MNGTTKRGRPRLYTDTKELNICKEYRAGASDSDLARKYFTTPVQIGRIRRRWNVPTEGRYSAVSETQKARWAAYRATPPWKRAIKRVVRKLRSAVIG
jgi:hypothetical protein